VASTQVASAALEKVRVPKHPFSQLQGIVPEQLYQECRKLAKDLQGVRILQLNATAYGGGVAEILKSFVPLCNDLGVETSWHIMPPDDAFFEVTKGFHNGLQGAKYSLSNSAKQLYMDHNKRTAELLSKMDFDVYVIHDPQPLAVIEYLPELHPSIWRCHIDTTTANEGLWNFLAPFVEKYDNYIFTMEQFAHHSLSKDKLRIFTPTIDPLTPKNSEMLWGKAAKLVEDFGIDISRPLVTQISRFDPWKDPLGVMESYRRLKKDHSDLQLALVGSLASDDPEAVGILEEVKRAAEGDPDIHILTNLDGVRDREVNAFQTASDIVIQKSIREGFGLTVSEALWKGTPVVAGNVGGITTQIQDGHTGYLVESVEECTERLDLLLRDGHLRELMGERGKEYVREHFLMARDVRDYFRLYRDLLRI
jgi:trehalose synthase